MMIFRWFRLELSGEDMKEMVHDILMTIYPLVSIMNAINSIDRATRSSIYIGGKFLYFFLLSLVNLILISEPIKLPPYLEVNQAPG